jgi:Cytochrome C and Quinol oxidase polypeptide I
MITSSTLTSAKSQANDPELGLIGMTPAQLQKPANLVVHPPEPGGTATHWREYFGFSTDHKVIGIQYLVTTFIFYLAGGVLATLVRTELATPEVDFVSREVYNSLFTVHATVMIFLDCPGGYGGVGQLSGALDDWGPRHGLSALKCPRFLDDSPSRIIAVG